ncbi:unnamed protein product [Microthlaspi erraticum]|uniref:Arabidopsis retrotransposon Orf1 C-terminal domain-containing protein n=1 Tax=Microthlaspi erraticum TaxID=1685480 RepID=A0A6D2KGB1_9BRAS|nr:unnamed protein product [Microthlaspi erraticum]
MDYFLGKGREEDGNLQAARDTLWFSYGEGNLWNIKEMNSKEYWATIAEEGYSSRSKAAQIRSPVLRYVHKVFANTFFARKATGTINEGEVKLLDMGIKPIISRTRDGKKIRGDRAHAGNFMPLLEQLLSYKVTAYNTRFQTGRKLSVGGVITPILCAAGVQLHKRVSTPAGWMDIKFCKTNLLIEHKELDGRPPVYTLVGHEDELREEEPELDRAEDRAEVQAEDRAQENADLGEPDVTILRSMRLQG